MCFHDIRIKHDGGNNRKTLLLFLAMGRRYIDIYIKWQSLLNEATFLDSHLMISWHYIIEFPWFHYVYDVISVTCIWRQWEFFFFLGDKNNYTNPSIKDMLEQSFIIIYYFYLSFIWK